MLSCHFSPLFQIQNPILKNQHKNLVCNFKKWKIDLKNMKKKNTYMYRIQCLFFSWLFFTTSCSRRTTSSKEPYKIFDFFRRLISRQCVVFYPRNSRNRHFGVWLMKVFRDKKSQFLGMFFYRPKMVNTNFQCLFVIFLG